MLPSPEDFAKGFYSDTGRVLDPDDPMLKALIAEYSSVKNGVLQIQIPIGPGAPAEDTAARVSCVEVANDFARANPELAERMGAIGLYKIAFACTAEKKGEIDKGYSQKVVAALSLEVADAWWTRPALWLGVAGGAVLAFFLWRRRKSMGLHGLRTCTP